MNGFRMASAVAAVVVLAGCSPTTEKPSTVPTTATPTVFPGEKKVTADTIDPKCTHNCVKVGGRLYPSSDAPRPLPPPPPPRRSSGCPDPSCDD